MKNINRQTHIFIFELAVSLRGPSERAPEDEVVIFSSSIKEIT